MEDYLGTIYTIIFALFLLSLIYFRLNQAKIKGKIGEKIVSTILLSLPDEYFLFNDVYLKINNRSIQIDHVVISVYGIFVIETKNYKGWIFGSEDAEYWTKNIYGKKYRFYNPIKQNKSHVKALQKILAIPNTSFFPIVVFLNRVSLFCSTESTVIFADELKDTIYCHSNKILSFEEVKHLSDKLLKALTVEEGRETNHKLSVRHEIYNKEYLISNGICPRCKGTLVERHGKYGTFWGCSNYPKCKFTI